MHRLQTAVRIALAAALLAAAPAGAAPPQVMTYSGYLKTSSGTAVTTATNITFRLYTAAGGGTSVWSETVSVTPSPDGWFSAVIGTTSSLPFSILNQDLYLSLQVASDTEFTQRARVTPSHSALTVDWGGVQGKPFCTAGAYLSLDGTGGLTCSIPPTGTGGITSVSGSRGITATTTGSSVSLTLPLCSTTGEIMRWDGTTWGCAAPATGGFTPPSCTTGQIMQWNGTAWQCAADATGLASVSVSAPLSGSGTGASPLGLAGCASAGQILQWNGASWSCIATPSGGGGVTSVSPNPGAGLEISPTTGSVVASLRRDCTDGQVLKWTAAGGWACASDANSGGTLTNVTVSGGALSATGTTVRDISLGAASNVSSGFLTAADYIAFSGKAPSPGAGCGLGEYLKWDGTTFYCAGATNNVSAVSPVISSGGLAPSISILQASATQSGALAAADFGAFAAKQERVTGTCAAGSYVRSIGVDGSVTCGTDANSGGTVTAVTATAPLTATTGATPNIALPTCAAGQVLRSTGTGWACAPDAGGPSALGNFGWLAVDCACANAFDTTPALTLTPSTSGELLLRLVGDYNFDFSKASQVSVGFRVVTALGQPACTATLTAQGNVGASNAISAAAAFGNLGFAAQARVAVTAGTTYYVYPGVSRLNYDCSASPQSGAVWGTIVATYHQGGF